MSDFRISEVIIIVAKLNDKQRKKIIAERVEGATIRSLANKYNVSTKTIQRVVNENADKIQQNVSDKKRENTKEVLAHMDEKKDEVCNIIDKILLQMSDDETIESTPLNKLATTLGILIDKFTASELTKSPLKDGNNLAEAISKSIKALGDDENDI